ncbi:hypothetical protein SAMN05443429_108123 [Cruoricaptor ignavus]|uniref:Peptidase S24/S26A/S26B/S26C domain-containing protein n=1 Tax=Cruoricaptor ignavus TaxID=1118202 RepID=A0A1M6GB50_9FLAO|nr:hypothetical protein SAMN05443429_108123 [Cruoricaptor ignavus]
MDTNKDCSEKQSELVRIVAKLKGSREIKTQKDLADAIGFDKTNLSSAINGNCRYLTDNLFDKIYNTFPSLNSDELNQPSALEQLDKIVKRRNKTKEELTPIPKDNYRWLEYRDLSVAAGMIGGVDPDLLPETRKRLVPHEFEKGNYLVVRVDGDSMDNGTSYSIPNGCEILIKEVIYDQWQGLQIYNNLFVIVTRDGTVLKQIIKHDRTSETLTLHSYNEAYDDYEVHMSDVLQIFIFCKITSNRPIVPDNYIK